MTMIKQNFTIEEKQMEQLRKYCKQTGLKMSTVVRMGLNMFFIREAKKIKNARLNKD